MNKVCELYYNACLKYGIEPTYNDFIAGFYFDFGKTRYIFRGTHTPLNDVSSSSISGNKYCTNRLLDEAGLPVPNADAVSKQEPEQSLEALARLSFPLVIKPTWDTSCGTDVTCNIKDSQTLNRLLDEAFEQYDCVSVEEYQPGLRSYRVLVLYDKVIGVVERIPAHVIGDGEHSIEKLIEIENLKREQLTKILPLGKIRIMPETEIIFKELGIENADYIPKLNERVPIRYICNSTFGGSIIGLDLKTICPENAQILCKAAKVLNLKMAGFDFICTDISIPYNKSKGFIIEANASPDISIHENVVQGVPTPVSETLIKTFIKKHWLAYCLYRMNHGVLSVFVRLIIFLLIAALGYSYYVLA